nr:hypothetical protein [uncultured Methanoregula sp.]
MIADNLFLFSSDSRHLYRHDIYNVLSYPEEFIIQFRYRKELMTNDLWNSTGLIGKSVIITAVVKNNQDEIEFIPLRKGQIITTKKFADDVLILTLKLLDEWVDISSGIDYNQQIKNLPFRPRVEGTNYVGQFITFGNNDRIDLTSNDNAWTKLIEKLVTYEKYKHGIFYRFLGVTELNKKEQIPVKDIVTNLSGIELTTGLKYSFNYLVYFGQDPPQNSEKFVLTCFNEQSLTVFNRYIRLGFTVDWIEFLVGTKGALSKKQSHMSIKIFKFLENGNKEEYLDCPQLEIPIVINPSHRCYFTISLIFFGLLLSSGQFGKILIFSFSLINMVLTISQVVDLFFQLLGSILVTIGIWILLEYKGE